MANFIVTYDLNGPNPSHKQVDDLLDTVGAERGRILETVWYVGWAGTTGQLLDHLKPLFSGDDLLFVAEMSEAAWTNVLLDDQALLNAWQANR
ncbi:hypothetical protein [Mesorhizobium marinum]|uniref:SinR family protein n=1 Tax=Mesorhizobium marinum TaxID=3228790 RepID=A0ABV3R625_9HYPH